MGSDGESTDDERSPVTLQIQLADRSKISVPTELDLTLEEFRLVLADLTGIPSDLQRLVHNGRILSNNPQTLRNYELDPKLVIHLVRRATPPPNTSISSLSRQSTPRSPRGTCKLDAANRPFKKPQTRLLDQHIYWIANIIERIPSLSQLEDTVVINYMSMCLYYAEIQRRFASLKAIITENIKAHPEGSRKLKSMYDGHHGISLGTEENQLSLCLSVLNLVGTSGSGPVSSNANRSESAPNSDPFPNPWAANSYRATIWPLIDYEETIDKIMLLLFSDATLLRHCMEQGESNGRAIAAVCVSNNATAALDAYFGPIEGKIHGLQNGTDYDSSHSVSGGSDDFAPKEAVSEEQFASQLAQMEEMGFMDRRENLRALLKSGGDVQKAVKRLLEKPNLDEGR